jgi:prepilin-type N-terminal cleavage/methylation domain-containing protein
VRAPPGIRRAIRVIRGNGGGFTLIELIVVLLIFSVLVAVTAPALFAPPPAAAVMEEAVGRFDALFRLAREAAVRSARPVTVVVDSVSGRVWFTVPADQPGRVRQGYPAPGGNATPDIDSDPLAGGAFGGGSTLGQRLGAPGAGLVVPPEAQPLALPEGIKITYFRLRTLFTFAPGGSATGDSLLLYADTGQNCLITIDPWSGRVQVR